MERGVGPAAKGVRAHRVPQLANPRGAIRELPLLTHVARGTIPAIKVIQWFEALGTHVRREYGDIASLFDLSDSGMVYPAVQPVSMASLAGIEVVAEDLPPDMHNFIVKENAKMALQAYHKKHNELIEQRPKIYGLVMGQLSEESIAAVRRMEGGTSLDVNSNDPKRLLEMILASHLTHGSDDQDENQRYARNQYESLAVQPGENIVMFRKRFDASVRACEVVGETLGNAKRRAIDFVQKLAASARYHEAVISLKNNRITMTNIDSAVKNISEFESPAAHRPQKIGLSYKISSEPNREELDQAQYSSDENTPQTVHQHPKRGPRCYECNGYGHLARDCANRGEAMGSNGSINTRSKAPATKAGSQLVQELQKQVAELMQERATAKSPMRTKRKGAARIGHGQQTSGIESESEQSSSE